MPTQGHRALFSFSTFKLSLHFNLNLFSNVERAYQTRSTLTNSLLAQYGSKRQSSLRHCRRGKVCDFLSRTILSLAIDLNHSIFLTVPAMASASLFPTSPLQPPAPFPPSSNPAPASPSMTPNTVLATAGLFNKLLSTPS